MSRHYQAIFFDMGYTLVYFDPPVFEVLRRALARLGIERAPEQIAAADQAVWGASPENAGQVLFPATPEYNAQFQAEQSRKVLAHLGVDPGRVGEYRATVRAIFDQEQAVRLYPDALEVLDALAVRGYRLGIISNWSWDLGDWVRAVGLDGRFEVVWASAYAGCNKPHPGIFYQALLQMNLVPAQALYVGDSYTADVLGALGVGMDVAWMDRTTGPEDDRWGVETRPPDGPAVPTFSQLAGLLPWLEGLEHR